MAMAVKNKDKRNFRAVLNAAHGLAQEATHKKLTRVAHGFCFALLPGVIV